MAGADHEVSSPRRAAATHRGLEVPQEVVEALGAGKRPTVTITINRHSWRSRVAIMRGRYLIGLSNANRQAAGVGSYIGHHQPRKNPDIAARQPARIDPMVA